AELHGLKPTISSDEIARYQEEFARRIAGVRSGAKQGDLFTPAIILEFHRLIESAMRGTSGANIRSTLRSGDPANVEVKVNTTYPSGVPLQTTPPTLLSHLPKLPPVLEYRVVGNALVLRDVVANVIIDFMPAMFTETKTP